jgi:hypothetical protein
MPQNEDLDFASPLDDEIFHINQDLLESVTSKEASEQKPTKELADFEVEQPPSFQTEEQKNTSTINDLKQRLSKPKKQKQADIPQIRDEITLHIEKIMEEGLAEAFTELSVIEQQEFKIKGEYTANQIRVHMKKTKMKVKKILKLLLDWLHVLPGINPFYLRQEAKIKADKIMSLKRQKDLENKHY